jgi:hypothetical protein
VNLIGIKTWVDWAIWLLRRRSKGVVDLPNGVLWRRLRICPAFYSLLSFLRNWTISGDVPFVLSMKETILPSQSWFLVFVPVFPLIVFLAFVLLLWCFVWGCLRHLLPLLAIPLLLYAENLLI